MEKEKNPTVFISYSHDSEDHLDRVYNLSNKLRSEGIDCILDQYEESPPEGWPRWMQRNIKAADFVIMVCTPIYYSRVMGMEDEGKGHGVAWEGNLIYQELYDNGSLNSKFIPVLFNDGAREAIPDPLRGSTFYDVENNKEYDRLYWRLRGVTKKKPELGKLRRLDEKPRKTMFFTSLIDLELWDKAKWKGVAYMFDYAGLEPPFLGLIFDKIEFGEEIFKGWRKVLGNDDPNNELRVSIVEGDVPGEDYGYYVHISQNIHNTLSRIRREYGSPNIDFIMTATRIHRMNPSPGSQNLPSFKKAFDIKKSFSLVPGEMREINGRVEFRLIKELGILLHDISFRNYEDIKDKNDYDAPLNKSFVEDTKDYFA